MKKSKQNLKNQMTSNLQKKPQNTNNFGKTINFV